MKKGVGSGSGFISQRYGPADPDPHQNVMDPQNWYEDTRIEPRTCSCDCDIDCQML